VKPIDLELKGQGKVLPNGITVSLLTIFRDGLQVQEYIQLRGYLSSVTPLLFILAWISAAVDSVVRWHGPMDQPTKLDQMKVESKTY